MKKTVPASLLFILLASACLACLLTACAGKAAEGEDGGSGADPYVGQWDDTGSRATLDIRVDEDGVYHGMGTWTKADDEVSFWEFRAVAGDKELKIEDCSREDVIYDDIKGDTDVFAYENATGRVVNKNGTLKWTMDNDPDTSGWSFEPAK